jgi:hypothetical protein
LAFKVKNGHLEQLLKNKDYAKIEHLLPIYLCKVKFPNIIVDFRDKWDHWINRFMQKKLLAQFFKVIPKDNPRLDLRTYTKIFDYFYTDMKDYDTLKIALQTYPKYLINLEHLLQVISDSIKHDESMAKND